MFRGLATVLWLKGRHLRAELNFWLWAAGADLDDTRDAMERIYLLYIVAIAAAAAGACWLWLLGLVCGAAEVEGAEMAALTADLARLAAGAAIAIPAWIGAVELVRAAWRAPWVPTAPDAAWLAQLPVPVAGWSACELVPRLLVRGVVGGLLGYLVAAYAATACGLGAGPGACLPYALAMGLGVSAVHALAWLAGEARIRAGREGRRVPLAVAGAAAIALAVLPVIAFPQLVAAAGALSEGTTEGAAIVLAASAATGICVAAGLLFARTITPAQLTRVAAADASLYAVRRMAVYDPKLYRSLVRSQRSAVRRPFGRMPRARGSAAVLARAAISTVRHCETLPQLLLAGAFVAPLGALLLSGALASQSAALGLLGGEVGARVMGTASWIMLAVQGADVQRALARVFIADTRNRFIRDHLPVSTPVLFAFATLPALAVALVAFAAVSAAGAALGIPAIDALALFLGSAALDLALALCGAASAADPARGRIRLSCEAATAIVAVACALVAALAPAAWYAAGFWAVALAVSFLVFRSM